MSIGRILGIVFIVKFITIPSSADGGNAGSQNEVLINEGVYTSFFKEIQEKPEIKVPAFYIDKYPVTNSQFNEFLKNHPQFQKDKVSKLFIDQRYLNHWSSQLLTDQELKKFGNNPVTYVSWFIANKYCKSQGKRLPTIAEWESASDFDRPEVLDKLLAWYSKTGDSDLRDVGKENPNKFGVHDMHGLIWELVHDFSSVMISSDSRSKGDRTDGFFCGGGSVSSLDSKSYATFMRYGFRSGLKGNYCIQNLGFRCARSSEIK